MDSWVGSKTDVVFEDELLLMFMIMSGLGDSNYTNFCNMGKMLNEKLLQLGAVAFYEAGFADDGVGLVCVLFVNTTVHHF